MKKLHTKFYVRSLLTEPGACRFVTYSQKREPAAK